MPRNRLNISFWISVFLSGVIASPGCKDLGEPHRGSRSQISSDAQLFAHITRTDPFTSYILFPNADSVVAGVLNGSNAHRPMVRVSMNAIAFNALQNGRLPSGTAFPNGSVLFKQVLHSSSSLLYAVIYKDRTNPLAANGWLWAEFFVDGSAAYSVADSGQGCIGCHALEQGPQNDFVRTFERQR